MVTRREAALAAACRSVLPWLREREAYQEVLAEVEAALEIKAKPTRRRAVLRLSQGALSLSWADRGVKITLHDEDKAQTRHWSGSRKPGKGDRVEPWEGR